MSDQNRPPDLEDIDRRLRAARAAQDPGGGRKPVVRRGDLGIGMRLGVEFLSAMAVGFALGYFVDRWLGTTPLLMLGLGALGMAAGCLNVFRALQQAEARRKAENAARDSNV